MSASTPPNESDGGRIPKACLPCARAKVRCEIEAGRETCNRCRRLKRSCSGQAPGAHRRKIPKPSNVASLEERYNGVTSILAASHLVTAGLNSLLASDPPATSPSTWIDSFLKSDIEADVMLQAFRCEMQPLFPFVVILPSITFAELRQEKPLLVLGIMMVSCRYDQIRQTAIAKKLRELISHKILIQGERNLDILQCLLVYLSWYQLHVHLGSQVGNLLHLIMAMATDLCLNRRVVAPIPAALAMRNPKIAIPNLSATRTLEEHRTFLGCFFLTSIASMCVRDIYPIQHSRYVEECCQAISAAAEYPTDNYVVHLTRLHGLADRISRSLNQDVGHGTPASGPAPLGACVKLLESELHQLRSSLLEGERQNPILLLHFYAIEIFLYQGALNDDVEAALYGMYPFSRLHILYACLNSTKLCFETAYTLPPSQWFDLPWSIWSLLGHAIVVLSRLSLLQAEGWDQEYVRRTINFSGTMDALAQQLDIARVLAESQSFQIGHNQLQRVVPQVFLTYSAKLRRVKATHEAKYMAQSMNSHPMPDLPPTDALDLPTDDDFAMPYTTFFCDFLDESFWQQFT